jgi:hypothetical protein
MSSKWEFSDLTEGEKEESTALSTKYDSEKKRPWAFDGTCMNLAAGASILFGMPHRGHSFDSFFVHPGGTGARPIGESALGLPSTGWAGRRWSVEAWADRGSIAPSGQRTFDTPGTCASQHRSFERGARWGRAGGVRSTWRVIVARRVEGTYLRSSDLVRDGGGAGAGGAGAGTGVRRSGRPAGMGQQHGRNRLARHQLAIANPNLALRNGRARREKQKVVEFSRAEGRCSGDAHPCAHHSARRSPAMVRAAASSPPLGHIIVHYFPVASPRADDRVPWVLSRQARTASTTTPVALPLDGHLAPPSRPLFLPARPAQPLRAFSLFAVADILHTCRKRQRFPPPNF